MINQRTLNGLTIAAGLLLTAYVAQDLHFNPRWYGDDGPGVAKLPREVVAGYMNVAYAMGEPACIRRRCNRPCARSWPKA